MINFLQVLDEGKKYQYTSLYIEILTELDKSGRIDLYSFNEHKEALKNLAYNNDRKRILQISRCPVSSSAVSEALGVSINTGNEITLGNIHNFIHVNFSPFFSKIIAEKGVSIKEAILSLNQTINENEKIAEESTTSPIIGSASPIIGNPLADIEAFPGDLYDLLVFTDLVLPHIGFKAIESMKKRNGEFVTGGSGNFFNEAVFRKYCLNNVDPQISNANNNKIILDLMYRLRNLRLQAKEKEGILEEQCPRPQSR